MVASGHGSRGGPHKRPLPSNEEAGKVFIEDGTDPFRLLKLKFKCFRLGGRSGIGPVRELFWRFRPVSRVRFRRLAGIFPESELEDRSRNTSREERSGGTIPEKLLS